MGLSASQARLLSITARLSDNELHSQQIANAKIRLADQTQDASNEYIHALNSKRLMFMTYDANGSSMQTELTPAFIYTYADMKNQYGIVNTSNQLLVSSTDYKNFQASRTMSDFVQCYGCELTDNPKYLTALSSIYGQNYADFYDVDGNAPKYNFGHFANGVEGWVDGWEPNMTNYDGWVNQFTTWDSPKGAEALYGSLIDKLGDYPPELKTPETLPYPVKDPYPPKPVYEPSSVLSDFVDVIHHNGCYTYAQQGKNCYMHVLSDMLGPGEHTTSSGQTFEVLDNPGYWNWNTADHPNLEGLAEVRQAIRETQSCVEPGKTIYQRIVDFLWDSHTSYEGYNTESPNVFGGEATQENLDTFFDIVDNDLKNAESKYSEDAAREEYERQVAQWEEECREIDEEYERQKREIDQENRNRMADYDEQIAEARKWQESAKELYDNYMDALANLPMPKIVDDDSKSQWYVNLWHRMNGESEYKDEANNGKYYKQLDDNLLTSESWLQFALEHAIVTMEQVQYEAMPEDITGLDHTRWARKIYTTCPDIVSVEDEVAVAKAEAEYKKKLNAIEAKDKRYDTDLKKLDTEHNALQTEYDSVKEVISKNVERSFKAFS